MWDRHGNRYTQDGIDIVTIQNENTNVINYIMILSNMEKISFLIEQIDSAETQTQANVKEMYWIKMLNSINNGYNSGKGGKYSKPAKSVINVETKEIFEDVNKAANVMNCCPNSIRQAIKYNYRCCGFHWKFLS